MIYTHIHEAAYYEKKVAFMLFDRRPITNKHNYVLLVVWLLLSYYEKKVAFMLFDRIPNTSKQQQLICIICFCYYDFAARRRSPSRYLAGEAARASIHVNISLSLSIYIYIYTYAYIYIYIYIERENHT